MMKMKRIGVLFLLAIFCTLFFSLPGSSVETTITAGSVGMGGIGVWSDTFQPLPGRIKYHTICNFTNMNQPNLDVRLRIRIWVQGSCTCPLDSTNQPLASAICRCANTTPNQNPDFDSDVLNVIGGQTVQLDLSNVIGILGFQTANVLARADWWVNSRPNSGVELRTAPLPIQINCTAIAEDSNGIMVGSDNFIPPLF